MAVGVVMMEQPWRELVAELRQRPQDRTLRSAFKLRYGQLDKKRRDPDDPAGAERARLDIRFAYEQLRSVFDELTSAST